MSARLPKTFCSLSSSIALVLAGALARAQDPGQAPGDERLLGPGRGLELTLDGARQLALRNSFGLKIDALASEIALYNARGSWGTFDWVFSASANATESEFQGQDIFAGGSDIERDSTAFSVDFNKPLTTGGTFAAHFDTLRTDTDSSSSVAATSTADVISLTYVQPLLRGAWRGYATSVQREAELENRRVDELERGSSQRLLLSVSNAYWDLVATREQLDVAESSLGLAREQEQQNRRKLEAGVGTEIEVLQAEAEVATREERRLFAQVRTRQADDALKQFVFPGTDEALWETSLIPRTPLPENITEDRAPAWTAALAIAIARRSELRQQRLAIDESRERYERRISERRPGLDLQLSTASNGFSGDATNALETTVDWDFPSYSATLSFNYPLANTTARYAEKAAWAELRAARLSYDQFESTIAGEVREAVRQVAYQAEAVRAAQKSLELAQRQLTAEQARDQVGQSTTFQVLQFQQDLALAMLSERTSRVNYAKALVALSAVQGLIGESAEQ